eukprot:Rmarinus@m.14325
MATRIRRREGEIILRIATPAEDLSTFWNPPRLSNSDKTQPTWWDVLMNICIVECLFELHNLYSTGLLDYIGNPEELRTKYDEYTRTDVDEIETAFGLSGFEFVLWTFIVWGFIVVRTWFLEISYRARFDGGDDLWGYCQDFVHVITLMVLAVNIGSAATEESSSACIFWAGVLRLNSCIRELRVWITVPKVARKSRRFTLFLFTEAALYLSCTLMSHGTRLLVTCAWESVICLTWMIRALVFGRKLAPAKSIHLPQRFLFLTNCSFAVLLIVFSHGVAMTVDYDGGLANDELLAMYGGLFTLIFLWGIYHFSFTNNIYHHPRPMLLFLLLHMILPLCMLTLTSAMHQSLSLLAVGVERAENNLDWMYSVALACVMGCLSVLETIMLYCRDISHDLKDPVVNVARGVCNCAGVFCLIMIPALWDNPRHSELMLTGFAVSLLRFSLSVLSLLRYHRRRKKYDFVRSKSALGKSTTQHVSLSPIGETSTTVPEGIPPSTNVTGDSSSGTKPEDALEELRMSIQYTTWEVSRGKLLMALAEMLDELQRDS